MAHIIFLLFSAVLYYQILIGPIARPPTGMFSFNNKNSCHLQSTYYVPGILNVFSPLWLMSTLGSISTILFHICTWGNGGTNRLSNLTLVTELVNGREGIWTKAVHEWLMLMSPRITTFCHTHMGLCPCLACWLTLWTLFSWLRSSLGPPWGPFGAFFLCFLCISPPRPWWGWEQASG